MGRECKKMDMGCHFVVGRQRAAEVVGHCVREWIVKITVRDNMGGRERNESEIGMQK